MAPFGAACKEVIDHAAEAAGMMVCVASTTAMQGAEGNVPSAEATAAWLLAQQQFMQASRDLLGSFEKAKK